MTEHTAHTPSVLEDSLLNRGVAFTLAEREALGLTGRLPSGVLTLEEQARRVYEQLGRQPTDLAKNVYLEQLHDRNEVLYYKVLADHLAELLPVVYDPTVGDAIKRYSHEYRRPRGIYLSIDRPDDIEKAFATLQLGPEDVDLIVCTDAEEILGIGDWGVGGIQISVGKLAVYTAAAGIDPRRVIPVSLDVGTDNEGLLNDPLYLGNRHARVRGPAYDAFIEKYLEVASRLFPGALLHFEDFGANNARRILVTYRDKYRIFNDDMQGTGAVVMAGLFNALKVTGTRWRDQRVVVFGGGTAGVGIADQIRDQMTRDGLDRRRHPADLDRGPAGPAHRRHGRRPAGLPASLRPPGRRGRRLGHHAGPGRPVHCHPLAADGRAAQGAGRLGHHHPGHRDRPGQADDPDRLLDRARGLHPAGHRDDERRDGPAGDLPDLQSDLADRGHARRHHRLVQGQGAGGHRPADPAGGLRRRAVWFGQANNALLYPGLGLGTIVSGASKVTDGMLLAAAEAVAGQADVSAPGASLLPAVENLRASSATTAVAVARAAADDGVATTKPDDPVQAVQDAIWQPVYPDPVS